MRFTVREIKNRMARFFSLTLSMCILFVLLVSPTPASFASNGDELVDIKAHWAETVIREWVSQGLIKGYGNGRFGPNDSISRAEFVTLLNRIFCYTQKSNVSFPDVKKDAWYAGEIAKAYQSGVIKGDSNGSIKPEAVISRQEAAVMLTRAFSLTKEYAGDALTGTSSGASPSNDNISASLKYADHKQIADWALDSVGTMTKKGYISGRPGNLFAPKDDLSRSEAVKMIDNVMGELINSSGTYTKTVPGNMVVSSQGVTLKDTNIDGDLYMTDGIGQDTIRLIGVTVKGRIIISGTLSGKVIVLSGDFGDIVIESPGSVITVESGAVGRFVVGKTAAGAVITGGGNIKNAVIASGGVTMDEKPQNVIIADGGKAVSYKPGSGNTGAPGGGGSGGGDPGGGDPGDGDDPGGGDPGDDDPGGGDPGGGDDGDPDDDPEPDTTAPSVPTGLTGTAVSSSVVSLSWTASTDNVGVTGYRIFRGGDEIGTSTTITYSDTGLTAGMTYSYAVSAYDATGNVSAPCPVVQVTPQEDDNQSLIPENRRIDWSHAGVPGGIPHRTVIYTTIDPEVYGNGETDASEAINAAIKECPEGQVVYLPAGTYKLSASIHFTSGSSGVTLRGAGPGLTTLVRDSNAAGITTAIYGLNNFMEITGGAVKGSTSIVVSDASSIVPGRILDICQADDPDFYWSRGNIPDHTGQYVMVTAVNGNTVEIEDPLVWTFDKDPCFRSAKSQGVSWIGIEDLTITADASRSGSMIQFSNAYASWIKNVETAWGNGNSHIYLYSCLRCEVRDSYIHDTHSTTDGYGILTMMGYGSGTGGTPRGGCTGMLIENNIFSDLGSSIILESEVGSVVAYNYSRNARASSGWANYQIHDFIGNHGPHGMMCLFEGNVASSGFQQDGYHGSVSHTTLFRNAFSGKHEDSNKTGNIKLIDLCRFSYYHNVIGNVLGNPEWPRDTIGRYEMTGIPGYTAQPVIYRLGYPNMGNNHYSETNPPSNGDSGGLDPKVKETLMRWGNFDYQNNMAKWDSSEIPEGVPVPTDHILPASLVYEEKPEWFGNAPWPAIGSDVDGLVQKIPAELRYEALQSGDTTPPAVPENLSSEVSQTTVNLSWTASTDNVGVTGYHIYRDGTEIGTSTTTSYSDTELTAGTTYSYAVSAYDSAGNISNKSGAVNITTDSGTVSGTVYYIDYENGDDANNGLTKSAPWKRHPFMSSYSGSYIHSAGDVFIFKGGVVWPAECFSFIIKVGGTETNPDIYTVDKEWYSGTEWTRPIFDMERQVLQENPRPVYFTKAENVVFEGFEVKNQRIYGTNAWSWGGITVTDTSNVTVRDCYIHDWYIAEPTVTPDQDFGGVYIARSPGAILENCVIHGSIEPFTGKYSGVGIRNNGYITRGCEVYDVANGFLGNGTLDGNEIHHIYTSYDSGDNTITPPNGRHANGVYLFGNAEFCNNYIHDILAPGAPVVFPAAGWNKANGTMLIYNNIIRGGLHLNADGMAEGNNATYHIYNNIIQANNSCILASKKSNNPIKNVYIKNVYIKNNILITTGTYPNPVSFAQSIDNLQVNSNIYYNHKKTNLVEKKDCVLTFMGHRYNLETSQKAGFNLISYVLGDPIDINYIPSSGTDIAVDSGEDLSSFIIHDRQGVSRPQGYGFDIGPSEFSGVVPEDSQAPTAPKNLSADEISTDNLKISWAEAEDDVGVLGFEIYRDGEFIARTNVSYYYDFDVVPDREYVYKVLSYDKAGKTSGASAELTVKMLAELP